MKIIWLILVLIFSFSLIFIVDSFYILPNVALPLKGELSQVESKAISLILDMGKTLTNFAIGLLGIIAYILKESISFEFQLKETKFLITSIILSSVLAFSSLLLGHYIYVAMADMLVNDFLDLKSNFLSWAIKLQYYFIALSTIILTIPVPFFYGKLRDQRKKTPYKSPI